jgi:hypothetical protein
MVAVGSALKVFSDASEQAVKIMGRAVRMSGRILASSEAERGGSVADA